MKLNDIHELLFQNGINLNDVDTYKKRGIGVYRKNKKIVGFNKKKIRTKLHIGVMFTLIGNCLNLVKNSSKRLK